MARGPKALSPDMLKARRAELQARLDALAVEDTKRHVAIGKAVEQHADIDPKFAQELRGILERNVTDRGERVCLGLTTSPRGRRARQANDATLPAAAAMPAAAG